MAIFGRNEEKYTGWAKIVAKFGLIKTKKNKKKNHAFLQIY